MYNDRPVQIKCNECNKNIIDDLSYQSWLSLVNYFEHEYDEENITLQTYERMTNKLMILKPSE